MLCSFRFLINSVIQKDLQHLRAIHCFIINTTENINFKTLMTFDTVILHVQLPFMVYEAYVVSENIRHPI